MTAFRKEIQFMIAALCFALMVSGCASPRKQVAGGLMDLGLAKRPAHCMADGLNDRLDKQDMKTLAGFLDGVEKSRRGRRIDKVINAIDEMGDERIATAAAKTGIACTVLR